MSEFLWQSFMIFIIKDFWIIVFTFIVISTTFWPICPPAFFNCLSNSVTYTELRTTSFIESIGVTCSDSVSHNRIQVLHIVTRLQSGLKVQPPDDCLQQDTYGNGCRHWFVIFQGDNYLEVAGLILTEDE